MTKKINLVLIILFYSGYSFAFVNGNHSFNKKDSLNRNQTYLFAANYGFMASPIGKAISNQGLVLNFGINPAYLFSSKIILGISGDLKLSGGFQKQGNDQFKNDVVSNIITQYNSPLDSVNIRVVKNVLTNNHENYITGGRCANLGVMFSPFPNKIGGLMLQVRTGTKIFRIETPNNEIINREYSYLTISKNWIYEVLFKVWTFKNEGFPNIAHYKSSIILSFHYERVNFGTSEFNDISISQMLSNNFMEKYRIDHRFGFKIAWGFY